MSKLFLTYEIGSLAKLDARVRFLAADPHNPVRSEDIAELIWLGQLLNVDVNRVVEMLRRQQKEIKKPTPEERAMIIDLNALINTRLQEASGIHFVYDGEARRSEMYRNVAIQVYGFEDLGWIRSRGADSWLASNSVAESKLKVPLDQLPIIREFEFVQRHATHTVKVPMDDPFMIVNMSGNEYYINSLRKQYPDDPAKLRYEAKRAFTLALAENVVRPQVEAVVNAGAKWIQLDIPSATIDIPGIPILVEGINAVVKDVDGVKFSLHICYPKRVSLTDKKGYDLLFPHILRLDPKVNHISLELANGSQYEQDIEPFARYKDQRRFEIGLGVIDITHERQEKGLIETPELIRDRILTAVRILGDPSLVYVAPDCGLRQVTIGRARLLYEKMVQGAELARRG